MDREIRKVIDMMVSGDSNGRMNIKRMDRVEEKVEERVEVSSEVVLEVGQKEREDLKKEVGAKGGRMYGEVLRSVGSGVAEGVEITEKMEEERMKWIESSMEREKRSGKVVEMVMDSQKEKSGKEWKKEEVVKDLGLAEGAVEKVEVKGNRVKVVVTNGD